MGFPSQKPTILGYPNLWKPPYSPLKSLSWVTEKIRHREALRRCLGGHPASWMSSCGNGWCYPLGLCLLGLEPP